MSRTVPARSPAGQAVDLQLRSIAPGNLSTSTGSLDEPLEWVMLSKSHSMASLARDAQSMEKAQSIMLFFDNISSCESTEALFHLLRVSAKSFGYDKVAYVPLDKDENTNKKFQLSPIMMDYPKWWVRRYIDQSFHLIDPVLMQANKTDQYVDWKTIQNKMKLSTRQKEFFDESRLAGLMNGLTVCFHGPSAQSHIISLASSNNNELDDKDKRIIASVMFSFHQKYRELTDETVLKRADPHLTQREEECLYWRAQGKTLPEISLILGISINTVGFHMKNLRRKLNCHDSVQAVVKGIKLGLIDS